MTDYPVYLYVPASTPEVGDELRKFLGDAGVPFEDIAFTEGSPEARQIADWSDGIENPFPLLRIGEKIRINLFHPSTRLVARLFPEGGAGSGEVPPLADLVMYSTNWCPDCYTMEGFLRYKGIEHEVINADKVDGMMANIQRWSGGRRTVPSFQWGQAARMFHPGMRLMGRLFSEDGAGD